MTNGSGGGELGLRERKKLQTRQAIADAAWRLFDRHGFAATTLPQIAAAADVSPRTVSHYFPVKEDLVFPDHDELVGELRSALGDRPSGQSATDAMRLWLGDFIEREPSARDRKRRVLELTDSDPGLRAYERALYAQAEGIVAAAFAADLGLPPDHHMPRMIGAATLAALQSLEAEDATDPDPEHARELLDDVLRFIEAGVLELEGGARAG